MMTKSADKTAGGMEFLSAHQVCRRWLSLIWHGPYLVWLPLGWIGRLGPVTLSDKRDNSADFQNVSPSASAGGTQRGLPEEETR